MLQVGHLDRASMASWEEVESFCHHHSLVVLLVLKAFTQLTLKLGREFYDGVFFAGVGAIASASAELVELASKAVKSGRRQNHPASQYPHQHLCLRNYQKCLA